MKTAFSFIEVILVVFLLGILSTFVFPKIQKDNVLLAANQVAMHLRYTQYLALLDDKSNLGEQWYKRYWRLFFHSGLVGDSKEHEWRYTVFSDDGRFSGNPNSMNQIANDPANIGKKLTSGFNAQSYKDSRISPNLNLSKTFGIKNITFKDCGAKNQTISFDNYGAPSGTVKSAKSPFSRRFAKNCIITLYDKNGKNYSIVVHAVSGFVQVISANP